MTAFGRAKVEAADRDITVEIRSVNSRYMDCTVKAPRNYICLEEKIKEYISQNAASRGKIDVFITVERHGAEVVGVEVDRALAAGYLEALRCLRDEFALPDDISVMSVARNQELFTYTHAAEDAEREWERLLPVLQEAVAEFCRKREAEGQRMAADLTEKLGRVAAIAGEIEQISSEERGGYRDRLNARIRQALADNKITVDENRILTEVAIYADRVAIDEELVRLRSHFEAFAEILAAPEPAGRRLDFLMQELNRETNTIGSKANNARIAHLVVDAKGELEKIREQVQNIE